MLLAQQNADAGRSSSPQNKHPVFRLNLVAHCLPHHTVLETRFSRTTNTTYAVLLVDVGEGRTPQEALNTFINHVKTRVHRHPHALALHYGVLDLAAETIRSSSSEWMTELERMMEQARAGRSVDMEKVVSARTRHEQFRTEVVRLKEIRNRLVHWGTMLQRRDGGMEMQAMEGEALWRDIVGDPALVSARLAFLESKAKWGRETDEEIWRWMRTTRGRRASVASGQTSLA